jgi:hypothetical protein
MRGTLRVCATLMLMPVQTSYRRVSRCSPVAFDFPLELDQADAETRPRCPETPPRQALAIDNPLWLHNSDPLTASGQFMLFNMHKSAACGYSIAWEGANCSNLLVATYMHLSSSRPQTDMVPVATHY